MNEISKKGKDLLDTYVFYVNMNDIHQETIDYFADLEKDQELLFWIIEKRPALWCWREGVLYYYTVEDFRKDMKEEKQEEEKAERKYLLDSVLKKSEHLFKN